jgi:hypothetical protein
MATTRALTAVTSGGLILMAILAAGCGCPTPQEEACDIMWLREREDAARSLARANLGQALAGVADAAAPGQSPAAAEAMGARIPQVTDAAHDGPRYWLHRGRREAEFYVRVTHGLSGLETWHGPVAVLPGGQLVQRRR